MNIKTLMTWISTLNIQLAVNISKIEPIRKYQYQYKFVKKKDKSKDKTYLLPIKLI